ncbi:hypothetical protein BGZ61DRAFT_442178 [Ilyonectria robusta]|uniref:uncharacterized protein n=1 Tax=Ilyonectria robusta TaxID=1079257 RepID=UPI001E8DA171|nr:uncharacterized protein BGZ61DRAFT_442178 [Ilyonectria robusta]KAH8736530.1 hypothetical protein BGZ61DRAFT_442178 [Ilyonectria robusta]
MTSEHEDYREDYHELINDGGRGYVDISLVPRPSPRWDEELEIWKTTRRPIRGRYYRLFQEQLFRWYSFRKWQRDQRGDEDDDSRFLEHAKSMQHRLAEHGFTRSFQLSRNPRKQDRLTTWIEYIGYECWTADNHAKKVKDEEAAYEQYFQDKLRSTDIVDHSVTKESLRLPGALAKYKAEYIDAMQTLALVGREMGRGKVSTADNERSLTALGNYEERRDLVFKIERFLRETDSYHFATVLAARNLKIVEWAIKEVPKVEAEMVVLSGRARNARRDRDTSNIDQGSIR